MVSADLSFFGNTTTMNEELLHKLDEQFHHGYKRINDRIAHAMIHKFGSISAYSEYKKTKKGFSEKNIRRMLERDYWGKSETNWHDTRRKKAAKLIEMAKDFDTSFMWLAYRAGAFSDKYEAGINFAYMKKVWFSLSEEQQLSTVQYVQTIRGERATEFSP